MAPSQRENRVPDKEAQEDDERQYGHGPLSAEELEQKRVTIFKSDFPWLTVSGIPIALVIIQRP
jgi:Mg/Co/Ni transporter MgtE